MNFNPHVDAFTQLIGYLVPEGTEVPEGLTMRSFPAKTYVRTTHAGPESELVRTYDDLYGRWMREHGKRPGGFDFEVWDERYKPESLENEIDIYIALGE
jgi:AraC family transcriptional regulator